MKTEKTTLQGEEPDAYLSPLIEQFTVNVEAGFALSVGGANEAGHQFEEKDEYSYDL